jgi:nondiscriminating glutamyl-tRNA synthetase
MHLNIERVREGPTLSVRVRYAPSPTGHLHIGGARTALFNWFFARQQGGKFVIRFEDTDVTRNVEHAEEKMLHSFRWLGIDWDEGPDCGGPYGPYRSTERLPFYREHADRLIARGLAYRCYCTKEELEADREEMMAKGMAPRYKGRCKHLSESERRRLEAENRPSVLRFAVPAGRVVRFHDRIRGEIEVNSDDIGDFVIVKSDGIPTYNFAVVVDDAMMRITHVIRGVEHLTNTANQILLYEALDLPVPAFAHVSLILNENGKKLSKRDESIVQFIEQYESMGYLPEAMVNFLALLGWSPGGEQEIFSVKELIARFSLDRVSKSGSVFDTEKLAWMNSHYMKQASLDRLTEMAIPHLVASGLVTREEAESNPARIREVVALYQEQMTCVGELPMLAKMFFSESVHPGPEEKAILSQESAIPVLARFAEKARGISVWNAENLKQLIKEIQNETGYKGKALFMPIRAAATGQSHGPDLNRSLALLGKNKVLARVEAVLADYGNRAVPERGNRDGA